MMEWWRGLTMTGQIFAAIAIPATVVMVLQSLLLLFGIGFDHDGDFGGLHHNFGDSHSGVDGSDGLALFTVRGIVAFFSVGGWTGLVCETAGLSAAASVFIAFLAGSVALVGIALLFKYSFKLQDSGNLDINNTLGKSGTVYIPIPSSRQGQGKVTVLVQERLTELDAVTDNNQTLKTGQLITVTEVLGDSTVVVTGEQLELQNQNKNEERGGISKWIQQ